MVAADVAADDNAVGRDDRGGPTLRLERRELAVRVERAERHGRRTSTTAPQASALDVREPALAGKELVLRKAHRSRHVLPIDLELRIVRLGARVVREFGRGKGACRA